MDRASEILAFLRRQLGEQQVDGEDWGSLPAKDQELETSNVKIQRVLPMILDADGGKFALIFDSSVSRRMFQILKFLQYLSKEITPAYTYLVPFGSTSLRISGLDVLKVKRALRQATVGTLADAFQELPLTVDFVLVLTDFSSLGDPAELAKSMRRFRSKTAYVNTESSLPMADALGEADPRWKTKTVKLNDFVKQARLQQSNQVSDMDTWS